MEKIKYDERREGKKKERREKGKYMELANLTDCEQLVMKTVWDAERELSLLDITKRVNERFNKEWKPQTVSTFLARLVKKRYLCNYRQGRVFYYQILISQDDYIGEIVAQFVEFWYQGSEKKFLENMKKQGRF